MIRLVYLLNLIGSLIAIPLIYNMLKESTHLEKNYKGDLIPNSMGLSFLLIQLVSFSFTYVFVKDSFILVYLIGLLAMGFVGGLDDFIGDTKIKGFKGHIGSFFKGRLTTGLIKAGIGFYISIFISLNLGGSPFNIVLNTFLIALSINLLNLFDLRPARAIKLYSFLTLIFLILGKSSSYAYIPFSLLVILIVYFKKDIRAEAMMGDLGSNILGITIGIAFASIESLAIRIFYTSFLIFINLLAEKVSISKLIEKNKFLNYIDMLGR